MISPPKTDQLPIEMLASMVKKPVKRHVEELHFELTYRCNCRCIMCDIWDMNKERLSSKEKELTLDEIKTFVARSKLLKKIKKVILSGGEPFLRDDLTGLCEFFISNYPDISIGILSNLDITDKVLNKTEQIISKCKPKNLWFGSSLDGTESVHDRIRERKGAFKNLVKTIKELKTRFPYISCSLTFTITPENYVDLLDSYRLAKSLNCFFGAQFVVQKDSTRVFRWDEEKFHTIEKQVSAILDEEYPDKDVDTPESIFWRNLVKYARKPKRYLKHCFMGTRIAMINPYGGLYVCPIHKDKLAIGNVQSSNFDNLWVSKRAENVRKYIDQEKCHCWLFCSVIPVINQALKDLT